MGSIWNLPSSVKRVKEQLKAVCCVRRRMCVLSVRMSFMLMRRMIVSLVWRIVIFVMMVKHVKHAVIASL